MSLRKTLTKKEYQLWIELMFGKKNKPIYTPEQLEQFRVEREAKRILEAPEREARRLENERIANLELLEEAMYFYEYYPWKRLSMMFLNMLTTPQFLQIIS